MLNVFPRCESDERKVLNGVFNVAAVPIFADLTYLDSSLLVQFYFTICQW